MEANDKISNMLAENTASMKEGLARSHLAENFSYVVT